MTTNDLPVLIMQCGGKKQEGLRIARDLYTGTLWNAYRKHAPDTYIKGQKPTHRLYVLSAKYGLIPGDELICPYDQKMTSERAAEIQDLLTSQIIDEGLDQVDPSRIFYGGSVGTAYMPALKRAGLRFTPLTRAYPSKRGGPGANLSAVSRFLQDLNKGKKPVVKMVKPSVAQQVLQQQAAVERRRSDLDVTEGMATISEWSSPQQLLDMGRQAGLDCNELLKFILNPDSYMETNPTGRSMLWFIVEQTWLNQQPENYYNRFDYYSGANTAGLFKAVVNLNRFPGVAIQDCRGQCFERFKSLKPGLHAFIDSGAFAEFRSGNDLPLDVWKQRYEQVLSLAQHLGYRVSIVMPDKIADPEQTKQRQVALRPTIQKIEHTGAELLLPLQKGSKKGIDGLKLLRSNAANLGVPVSRLVPAIPMPAGMWTHQQIIDLAGKLPGNRMHLLGNRTEVVKNLILNILAVRPDMLISTDSVQTRLSVGWTGNKPQPTTLRRVRTVAQDIDPEVLFFGYAGASEDLDEPSVRKHLEDAFGTRKKAVDFLTDRISQIPQVDVTKRVVRGQLERFFDGAALDDLSLPMAYLIPSVVDDIPRQQIVSMDVFKRFASSVTGGQMTRIATQRTIAGKMQQADPFNWGFVLAPEGVMFTSFDQMLSATQESLMRRDKRLTEFGAEELIRFVLGNPRLTRQFTEAGAGVSFDDFVDFMTDYSEAVYQRYTPWTFSNPKIKKTHPANDARWRVLVQTA
jgi:hypothetical protein